MLASADAAEGIGAMPAELELGLLCERWKALPNPGGVLDQPVGLLARMSTAVSVYRAIQSEQAKGDMTLVEFSRRYPDAWRTIARVDKLRRNNNGN